MAKKARLWKQFQNQTGKAFLTAEQAGDILGFWEMEDGARTVTTGYDPRTKKPIYGAVQAKAQPSDYGGINLYGGLIICECKFIEKGTRLPCSSKDENGLWVDRKSGVKENQVKWIIKADQEAGVGMLIVCFWETMEVFCLYGFRLKSWLENGEDGKQMASISLKYFRKNAVPLGNFQYWRFCREHFLPVRYRKA